MSEPTSPQPKFWDVLPQIIGKLKNEFLLVTLGIFILVIAIGVFAPGVVDSLGRGFFYLLVVLAWLAYLIVRVLEAWLKVRQTRPPAGSGEPPIQADHGSTVVGDGNVNLSSDVTVTQEGDHIQIGGPIRAERIEAENVVSGVQIVQPPETLNH